jgi:hypothetical protein
MLEKNEKTYLIVLVLISISLIFTVVYITYDCPNCNETFAKNTKRPVIIYKL